VTGYSAPDAGLLAPCCFVRARCSRSPCAALLKSRGNGVLACFGRRCGSGVGSILLAFLGLILVGFGLNVSFGSFQCL